jgi:hypothetical protein
MFELHSEQTRHQGKETRTDKVYSALSKIKDFTQQPIPESRGEPPVKQFRA